MKTNGEVFPANSGTKILVVEDEGIVARDLKRRLENNGFEVTGIADNAADATRLLDENPPDLVLMDIVIQGDRDGISTAKEVREHHDIPVVFLTAHSDARTVQRAKSALPYGYLIKPFDERELLTGIEMAICLHRSELRQRMYERAIATAPAGVAIIDALQPDHPIVSCNASFERITGYSEADLSGGSLRLLEGPGSDRSASEAIHEAIRNGQERQTTVLHYRKDGTSFWDELCLSPVLDTAGRTTHFITVQNDVTENKLSRDRIHQQAQLIEQAMDAIFVCDVDGKITFMNPEAVRLYGFGESEVLGFPATARIWRETSQDFEDILGKARGAGKWHGEVKHQTRDGGELIILSRISLLCDEKNNPSGFLIINHDVTSQKELERQLERSQRQEILGSLAGGIAHDLNNALAPILMGIEMLKEEKPQESMIIDLFESSADRAAKMVRQLLTFARGSGDELGSIEASHLIREMKDIITNTFPKNISAFYDYEKDLPLIQGNAIQLHQVLLNLCVNARDAMPEGGVLTLSAKLTEIGSDLDGLPGDARPGHYVILRVEDSGTGIPPELRDQIFEPFFSTKAPEKGTGIGLSTTKGIVHAHQGWLEVDSAEHQGTIFTVYLPVQEASVTAPNKDRSKTLYRGQGELVLYVDDDPAMRRIARAVLERLNFSVVLANDGIEGMKIAMKHQADLRAVITDMQMPKQNGFEFVKALRPMLPDMPIVVSSGLLEDDLKEQFESMGPIAFLGKPFSEDLMAAVMQKLFLFTGTCIRGRLGERLREPDPDDECLPLYS